MNDAKAKLSLVVSRQFVMMFYFFDLRRRQNCVNLFNYLTRAGDAGLAMHHISLAINHHQSGYGSDPIAASGLPPDFTHEI
jgi:hypothetical protein